MSLQLAAKHLASKGRGADTQLVHMSPSEVKSLQQIAMANGGSLSVNPNTGLPEAGFLSSILPMVAGAALTATGVGAPLAALMVGGGTSLATGSLGKGLMAGLGAFGGAGLGAGLMGAGAAAGPGASVLDAALANPGEAIAPSVSSNISQMGQGLSNLATDAGARSGFMTGVGGMKGLLTSGAAGLAPVLMGMGQQQPNVPGIKPTTPTTPLQYSANQINPSPAPDVPGYGNLGQDFGRQQRYFNPAFTPAGPASALPPITTMPVISNAGLSFAGGGPIEQASNQSAVGQNFSFPMANIQKDAYASALQQPIPRSVVNMQSNPVSGAQDTGVDQHTGEELMAGGGLSNLGDYSDGGRLLRGPGDGVSDSIPAMIGSKQPARLADGEFVVPARIVSELGNGSTDAGARKLYAMMDRVQRARSKTVGKNHVARNTKADKYLPA